MATDMTLLAMVTGLLPSTVDIPDMDTEHPAMDIKPPQATGMFNNFNTF